MENGKRYIYDPIRKKHLVLQPEELVRQLIVQYLLTEKNYPIGKIALEVGLKVNNLQKRCDILIYDAHFQPFFVIECKAPQVPVDAAVFEQAAIYNMALKVPYLMVSNGIANYCCRIIHEEERFEFLNEIPDWKPL
jgi:hypothetical protein